MEAILLILGLVCALFALATGIKALRAYLGLRRARADLRDRLTEEVDSLALRTTELEKSITVLDARAQQLPVRISSLQQNLATLRILTGALATSLRQVQMVLSYAELKTFSATRVSDLLQMRGSANVRRS